MADYTTLRTFQTRHFAVVLDCTYDDDYENDVQDENGDTCQETQDKLNSGEWTAYTFRVRVLAKGHTLGTAYLGGSIYANPEDFMDHRACGEATRKLRAEGKAGVVGSYFADMVREAIADARYELRQLRSLAA